MDQQLSLDNVDPDELRAAFGDSGRASQPAGGPSTLLDKPGPREAAGHEHFLDASQDMVSILEHEKATPEALGRVVKRLQAMLRISSIITDVGKMETLLDRILDCILEVFPAAERVFIVLPDEETGQWLPRVGRYSGADGDDEFFAISQTILNYVVERKQSILSNDATHDFGISQSIVDLSLSSMMCAPLLYKGEILGFLNVDNRKTMEPFSADDLAVLTGIAHQVALAVKNADLFKRLSEAHG